MIKFRIPTALRSAIVAAILGAAWHPASAERIETFWRLERVGEALRTAAEGQPFLEQRLLPVRLVRLTEPISIGRRTLPAGTFLYLVFNAEQRVGYCTIKDRTAGNQARTLFIPILDQRPCLTDSDGDGRFDRSFSVYDKWGGPPSVRGSINGAEPLGVTAAFEQVDVHLFPIDMRMMFEFRGSDPRRARVRATFSSPIGGAWQDVRATDTPGGGRFEMGAIVVLLRGMEAGRASFDIESAGDTYVSSDNRNNIYFNTLPAFLAGS